MEQWPEVEELLKTVNSVAPYPPLTGPLKATATPSLPYATQLWTALYHPKGTLKGTMYYMPHITYGTEYVEYTYFIPCCIYGAKGFLKDGPRCPFKGPLMDYSSSKPTLYHPLISPKKNNRTPYIAIYCTAYMALYHPLKSSLRTIHYIPYTIYQYTIYGLISPLEGPLRGPRFLAGKSPQHRHGQETWQPESTQKAR